MSSTRKATDAIERLPIKLTIDDSETAFNSDNVQGTVSSDKKKQISSKRRSRKQLSSTLDPGIEDIGVYVDVHPLKNHQPADANSSGNSLLYSHCNVVKPDNLLEKSVIKPGFEKLESVPKYEETRRQLRKQRKLEAEKTKGSKWYNLPAPEMTEEKLRDLEIIQMRSILNPKQFYKKNDLKVVPKYFQVGTILDNAADFYHDRVPRKQRKKTLVDELMADATFQKYNKKKYAEIIQDRSKSSAFRKRPKLSK